MPRDQSVEISDSLFNALQAYLVPRAKAGDLEASRLNDSLGQSWAECWADPDWLKGRDAETR